MQRPSNRVVRHTWKRWLFWFWIGGSILVAAYLFIAAPLVPHVDISYYHVALIVPPFLLLMLATGLAWLVMLVVSKKNTKSSR